MEDRQRFKNKVCLVTAEDQASGKRPAFSSLQKAARWR